MTSEKDIMAELMAVYLAELQEQIEVLQRDLLKLEKATSQEDRGVLLKTLFRAAHNVKGSSKSVGMDAIAATSHKLEDILVSLRGGHDPTQDLISLMLKAVDRIEAAWGQLSKEPPLDSAPLEAILPELEAAASALPLPLETAAEEPNSPSDPGAGKPSTRESSASDGGGTTANETVSTRAGSGPTPAPPRGKAPAPASVRVAAEKLDALMAHSGELLVARRRVQSRTGELNGTRHLMARWHTEWRDMESRVLELLRRGQSDQGRPPASLLRKTQNLLEQNRHRFQELEQKLDSLASDLTSDGRNLGQVCGHLEDQVLRVRMLPFVEACRSLERAVRDAALSTGKQVELKLLGEDVEVDRSVVEALKDPLLHLVRNAVDHGLESPEERVAAGKKRQGTVTVQASLSGSQVEVRVSDDGRGLDLRRIREKLSRRGIVEPYDDHGLARAVFMPGFSTAEIVTDLSGRGVGLDVVSAEIEELHGNIDIQFEAGKGTSFTLMVPLTLTTVRSVKFVAAGQVYLIPTINVDNFVRFQPSDVSTVAGREVLLQRDFQNRVTAAPIPVVPLASVLGLPAPAKNPRDTHRLAVVVSSGPLKVGIVVDEVVEELEITVKSLGPRIGRLKHISGATLLESGRIALVLNVANVVRSALSIEAASTIFMPAEQVEEVRHRRLLVVDDSVTTRSLLKSILETAGYEVVTANDGSDALEKLADHEIDAVVSDVDMPRMNGFELTKALRDGERNAELPIILVTARSSDADRARGVAVGANAYITKSGFDQSNLLKTVAMMV